MRQIKLPSMPSRPRRGTRPVVGLDIEPGAVHVVEAIPGADGRPVVQRSAMRALEPGVIRDGEIVDAPAVTAALKALFDEHGFDRRVRIGIANQRILVRVVDLPPITDPKELAQAIAFQAPSEVPMPLDQAVLDHVSLGVVETPAGPRSRVVLVAARRDMIEKLLAVAREAGLRPEGIDLAAFALVRSLAGTTDEVVAYLAVGGVVNLVVARGGTCLFTRVIGGGVDAMAVELAERRGVTIDEARTALTAATAERRPDPAPAPEPEPVFGPQPEPVAEVAEAVAEPVDLLAADARQILADGVRRIGREVRASLDFHSGELAGTDGQDPVQRIVLTGPGLELAGLADALADHLGLPVDVGLVPTSDGMDAGRYTIAAGLALEEIAA
jgi:type IV pilus assembly protein PilM